MRLAQLARKIAVKPSEIAAFLAARSIEVEDSSNAKINDDHVVMVLKHFSPETLMAENSNPEAEHATEEVVGTGTGEMTGEPETHEPVADQEEELEITETTFNEVIKPPKVELPGLKVVGKIDLPEPKKKEEKIADDQGADEKAETSSAKPTRPAQRKHVRPNQEERRPRKNPIALQREREEREALRRKLEQKKKEKELRTQRYIKKVSTKVQVPKAVKKPKHEDEYEVLVEEETKPKSFIGKILGWFVSD